MGGRYKSIKVSIMSSRDMAKTKFHLKDLLWYTLYYLIKIVIKNNDSAVIQDHRYTKDNIVEINLKAMTSFYFRAQRMFSPIGYHINSGTN